MRGSILRAAAVLGLTSLLLFQAACDEDKSFYIYQNQVPESGCVVTTDDTIYRSQGVLDVSLGAGYVLFPLLRNDLPTKKPAEDISDRPEPNQLHMREFRVKLDLGSTPHSVPPGELTFSRPTSGVLLPGDKRASAVEIIPDDVVKKLKVASGARPMVIAEIKAVAESGEGDVYESLPFYYPVSLCNGCLVVTLGACPTSAAADDSNVCGLPQDGPLVCCTDSALGFHCLAGN